MRGHVALEEGERLAAACFRPVIFAETDLPHDRALLPRRAAAPVSSLFFRKAAVRKRAPRSAQ
jgi:hypothetical protein